MKPCLRVVTAALLLVSVSLPAVAQQPLVTEAVVNAPVDAVWKAWTTKTGLEAWLVAKTEIELKVGGTWRTSYSPESNLNDDLAIQSTILAFDPGRMISFRTTKQPKDFPYAGITSAWTVLYFEPAGAGTTRVVARMFGPFDGEEGQKLRAFFERGNRYEMDKMVKFFENGIPAVLR